MKIPRLLSANPKSDPLLPAMLLALAVGGASRATAQTQPATTNRVADAKSPAAAAPAASAESTEELANWITLGVGGVFTSGDRAQFQERWGKPAGVLGGLQDFHFETFLGKKGTLELDGRSMFGEQNYSVRFGVADPDVGYLRAGFKQTRTWYDGSGGYFPATKASISYRDQEIHVDRGEYWIEGGWTPPSGPMLTLKLAREYRNGSKDSLIWGDSPQAGTGRGLVPSFREFDEVRHRVEADVKHTFGNTDVGLGVRLDLVDNRDAFKERRQAVTTIPPRYVTQRDLVESDLFNVHASTETRINDWMLLTSGYSFTRLNTEIGGSRIYGASFDAPYLPAYLGRYARDEGFVNLTGGSVVDQYVMNLALRMEPAESWVVVPSLRAEKIDTSGDTSFTENSTGATAPYPATAPLLLHNSRDNGFINVTEAVEVRFTGFTNWVLYGRCELTQSESYLRELEQDVTAGTTDVARNTELERLTQKYTVGANWYPFRRLNFSGQFYHLTRENNYTHLFDSTPNTTGGDRYPAFLREQRFQTDDFNVRATWRPLPSLTSVTRYDFQVASLDTAGGNLARVESAQTTAHIISQSLTWVPWSRLLLQGSLNYSLDATTTPATGFTGGTTGMVGDANNDYWQASASATLVLDDKTDFQAGYSYYRASNFINNSPLSMPYGVSATDSSVSASLIRNFSKRVRGTLSYGYFKHRDETAAGRDSYDAHLLYSSITYRF